MTVQDFVPNYPWTTPPDSSAPFPVAPGISWIRMPLPFQLDHINLWILDDIDDTVVIVDTGVSDPLTQGLWQRIAEIRPGHRLRGRLFCTHFHPDHMGLAGWLCRHFPLTFMTPAEEWNAGGIIARPASEEQTNGRMAFYKKAGLSNDQINNLKRANQGFAKYVTLPPDAFQNVQDQERITVGSQVWNVVSARGHSPNMACLWNKEDDVFIASDQILPRISPNISVWPDHPEANPLQDYRDSLYKLKSSLTDSTLILPSHGLPFRGASQRIDQILTHHVHRLNECFRACSKAPHSALDLVPILFPKADDRSLLFAIGEAIAHAHALQAIGSLESVTSADGVIHYQSCHLPNVVNPGQHFLHHDTCTDV